MGRGNGDTVDPEWLDYDRFKTDVMATPGEGRLTRIDDRRDGRKWMPRADGSSCASAPEI